MTAAALPEVEAWALSTKTIELAHTAIAALQARVAELEDEAHLSDLAFDVVQADKEALTDQVAELEGERDRARADLLMIDAMLDDALLSSIPDGDDGTFWPAFAEDSDYRFADGMVIAEMRKILTRYDVAHDSGGAS